MRLPSAAHRSTSLGFVVDVGLVEYPSTPGLRP
jgi:hypothetical protein